MVAIPTKEETDNTHLATHALLVVDANAFECPLEPDGHHALANMALLHERHVTSDILRSLAVD